MTIILCSVLDTLHCNREILHVTWRFVIQLDYCADIAYVELSS